MQTNITETNHSFQGYMLITSKTFWNGLLAEVRGELETRRAGMASLSPASISGGGHAPA